MELLKRLSEAPGIPGHEEEIRALVKQELEGLVDELSTDILGNVIGRKRGSGNGRKVMLAAHMDEIGFMVKHIEKEGFLRIEPLGGFDPRVLPAKRVVVCTAQGKLLGSIGSKPVHILSEEERKKPVELKHLFIDLGMSAEEVQERVRVGDPVTLRQDFVEFGEVVSGFEISPHVGLAVDTTLACDVPGVDEAEQITRLGGGAAIKLKDSASIDLIAAFLQVAHEGDYTL